MNQRERRFSVTLAPREYRAIRDLATAIYPGSSERAAITRYIEGLITDRCMDAYKGDE